MQLDSVQDSTRYVISGVHHGAVLPGNRLEMMRDVFLLPGADVRGGIWCNHLTIHGPDVQVAEAVYSRAGVTIDPDKDFTGGKAKSVTFSSCLTCRGTLLVSPGSFRIRVLADLYADRVNLSNCVIYGNIYANEAIIRNSVILGGVFTRGKLEAAKSFLGTFRARRALLGDELSLFFPYAVALEDIQISQPVKVLTFFSLYQQKRRGVGDQALLTEDDVVELKTAEDGVTLKCLSLAERILDGHSVREHLSFNRRFLEHLSLGDNLDPEHKDPELDQPLSELEDILWKTLSLKKKPARKKGVTIQELFERFFPQVDEGDLPERIPLS
jgi:hypothetical protein